jgi:hypothetical protein
MRYAAALVAVTGCRAVFGLEPPDQQQATDAARADSVFDVPRSDAAPPGACSSATTDLVACFDFEGTAADLAPSANAVSAQNLTYAAGQRGQAAVLGASSRIAITDSVLLDIPAFTIEAWVYMTAYPSVRSGVWDTDGQYAVFIDAAGNIACTTGGSQFATGTVALDTWTHIACTAEADNAFIYINGVKKLSGLYNGAIPTAATNGAEVGGNAPDGSSRFIGKMDLLRVYRRALTQPEICADAGC